MISEDEAMPDTQPCENWTQTQSQDPQSQSSQSTKIWGNLIPISQPKWGISLPPMPLSNDYYSAGRISGCDIMFGPTTIIDKYLKVISKIHFRIVRQSINGGNDSVIYLEDYSQNGTFINSKLVGKGNRCVLDHDDKISLSQPSMVVWRFKSLEVYIPTDLPPIIRSEYALIRQLGEGACGTVKLVYSKSEHKALALKVISKNMTTTVRANNGNNSDKIMNEVRILKALNNPFIIKMFNVFDTSSHLYIVLELMEGGDLLDRIRLKEKKRMHEKQIKHIFYQIVKAVDYLHTQGITHRDLKPENILLASHDEYPLAKVCDFGLSKFFDTQTVMTTICGTPLYVAPEILRTGGLGAYTNLVDVWSLGVILYASISGCAPFHQNSDQKTLHAQILRGKYNFPQCEFQHVSKQAIELIRGMLTVEASKRKTIRQVMFHSWLLDRDVKFRIERQLRDCNSENTSPNIGHDNEIDEQQQHRNNQRYEMILPIVKRPRLESRITV